jgi:hypothetical protein
MKFSADTSGLQSQIQSVSNSIKTAFGATAVTGLATLVKSVASYAGGIQDLAEQTGFSTDALQELNYAAINGGSSIEDMTTAIRKMQDVLGQQKATDDQIKALDKLGLGFHQLKAMSPEDAFKALAKAISGIPDQMTRTATAIDFFGKGGMKIAAMAGDMDKFAKAAHDAGAVVDKELIKSVADFDDKMQSAIMTVKSWGVTAIGAIQKVAAAAGKLAASEEPSVAPRKTSRNTIESREEPSVAPRKTSRITIASREEAKAEQLERLRLQAENSDRFIDSINPLRWVQKGASAMGMAAGGSVGSEDVLTQEQARANAAAITAENIKKTASIEAAAAQDKKEKDDAAWARTQKQNADVLRGIESARSADERAGDDALAAWNKRLDGIKKVDAARKALADAEKRQQEQALDAADKADANRRDKEIQKLEAKQDEANQNLENVQQKNRQRLGGADFMAAFLASRESGADQRKRRKKIEEEERFRELMEDRIAGRGGKVRKKDLAKLAAMNDELARAKGFKNAADMKADAAKKDAQKAQDLKDQRDAAKAAKASLAELIEARKALDTIVANLRVNG